jgi:long-chain acyl-CoA synthetase
MDTILLAFKAPPAGAGASQSDTFTAPDPAQAVNLAAAFAAVAGTRAAHAALATKTAAWSYGAILSAAQRVNRFLRARQDYSPGMRVALQLSNSADYVAAFYGTLLADAVAVPLPAPLETLRLRQILDSCMPAVLLTRPTDAGEAVAGETLDLGGESSGDARLPARGGNDLAMLLFTSGSTGAPKGVMLSHRNLLANAASILHRLPIVAGDRALVVIPFCHAFGNSILQTHILSGATLILGASALFPAALVETLRETETTSFSAVPDVFTILLRYGKLGDKPLPQLRYMSAAGGELRYEQAARVAAAIAPAPFFLMYGQAEATARLAVLPPEALHTYRGSIGKPIYGVALAVHDEAGRDLPAGETGMLCARGDNVMLGYWQDADTTAATLRDDWLRTGDLAHRDADGFFYLHGRASLLTKVQGHRVHPAEIEAVVEVAFPQTSAVAVAVPRGDDMRFVLFLAPRDTRPPDIAAVRATCQRELPPYKQPVDYRLLDRFPLNAALKTDRAALARLALEAAAGENSRT